METKVCKKCGRELPLDQYFRNKATKDGHESQCKECKTAYTLEYQKKYRARKRERAKENERIEFEKKYKIYTNRDLAKFTPRELMLELKARGYEGELVYIERIVKEHRINLSKLD